MYNAQADIPGHPDYIVQMKMIGEDEFIIPDHVVPDYVAIVSERSRFRNRVHPKYIITTFNTAHIGSYSAYYIPPRHDDTYRTFVKCAMHDAKLHDMNYNPGDENNILNLLTARASVGIELRESNLINPMCYSDRSLFDNVTECILQLDTADYLHFHTDRMHDIVEESGMIIDEQTVRSITRDMELSAAVRHAQLHPDLPYPKSMARQIDLEGFESGYILFSYLSILLENVNKYSYM